MISLAVWSLNFAGVPISILVQKTYYVGSLKVSGNSDSQCRHDFARRFNTASESFAVVGSKKSALGAT